MVASDFILEVEMRPFRTCAMHPAMGTVRSLWTWLWGRYHVPQNALLVSVKNLLNRRLGVWAPPAPTGSRPFPCPQPYLACKQRFGPHSEWRIGSTLYIAQVPLGNAFVLDSLYEYDR